MSDESTDTANDGFFNPDGRRVRIAIDALVQHEESVYRISQILDFESVVAVEVESGRPTSLAIHELRALSDDAGSSSSHDLKAIKDEQWHDAQRKYAVIKPFIDCTVGGRKSVEERAAEMDVSTTSIYRWIKRYREGGTVSSLIDQKRGWTDGRSRLIPQTEAVIEEVIESYYLTPNRPTAQKAIDEIERLCHERAIEAPSSFTVRRRIRKIEERTRLRRRGFQKKADALFQPTPGKYPDGRFPLEVVQIDHTKVDIVLLDDIHRKPIGRPWITLAMDIYSRMVTGYYLSFDPPSGTSVGLCVAHSMLSKEGWLERHEIDTPWEVWGTPRTIHVDNGADFRSENFQRSCMEHGINLEFRPVKVPRYGAHIERLLGTLMKEIHDLPGTTFSSVAERGEYDPEKHAVMTKSEFEQWLVALIIEVYHQKRHGGIGMPPSRQWEIGIHGNGETVGVGLPDRYEDRRGVLLDFMPAFERTVQTGGVQIAGIRYYSNVLDPYINKREADEKSKRKFVFRRDPRDIGRIYFHDAELGQYAEIPYADRSLPTMSHWEYEAGKRELERQGLGDLDEPRRLRAIAGLRKRVDDSSAKTKTSRREAQRRRDHANKPPLLDPAVTASPPSRREPADPLDGFTDGDLGELGDIV